jgi:hypothetical protein
MVVLAATAWFVNPPRVVATDPFAVYLNDHLAGARAALQLLDRLVESTSVAGVREQLTALHDDIAEDRDVLEDISRRVADGPSAVREAGGWIAEKLSQLKLVIDDPSNGPLRRFEALEVLALGILGKAALWRALSAVAAEVPALAGVDFDDLRRRAEDQHARAEKHRLAAARSALITAREASATPSAKR